MGCPVRLECLAEALDARIEWGVWGGMTERERRAVLRRRPRVQSWRRLLEAAREEYVRDDLDGDLADAGALTSVQRVTELASAQHATAATKAQLAS